MRAQMNPGVAEQRAPKRAPQAGAKAVSLLRYSPALVAVVIALADSARFTDPDLWWHLRSGQEILRLGHPLFYDPYSYTAHGHPWLNHEWLADAIFAASYRLFGVFGLKLVKLACTAATILFLSLALAETGASALTQLGLLILTALAIQPQMQFRPQVFTFALMSALVALLARDTYRREGRLWIAIPILALWANLHGGFLMGIVALAIYAGISGVQDWRRARGPSRGLQLGALWCGALAATLATPYGLETWRLLFHALTNPYTRNTLADWKPLWRAIGQSLSSPSGLINYVAAAALILGMGAACVLAAETIDVAMVVIAATMAAAGVAAVRNLPLAVITAPAPLAHHLALRARRRVRDERAAAPRASRQSYLNQTVAALLAIFVLIETGFFSRSLRFDEPYPAGALAFMERHRLSGNLLCKYGWGGYVIYHASPATRMFIDPRFDTVYPERVIGDYLAFHFNLPRAKRALDDYPTQLVLIEPQMAGAALMASLSGWTPVYRDRDSILYARAGSPASKLSDVPATGAVGAQEFP